MQQNEFLVTIEPLVQNCACCPTTMQTPCFSMPAHLSHIAGEAKTEYPSWPIQPGGCLIRFYLTLPKRTTTMYNHDDPWSSIKNLCSPITGHLFFQVIFPATDDRVEFLNQDDETVMICTADSVIKLPDETILGRIRLHADRIQFEQAETSPVKFGEIDTVDFNRVEAYLELERNIFLEYLRLTESTVSA